MSDPYVIALCDQIDAASRRTGETWCCPLHSVPEQWFALCAACERDPLGLLAIARRWPRRPDCPVALDIARRGEQRAARLASEAEEYLRAFRTVQGISRI